MVRDVFIAIDTYECEHMTITNDETSNVMGGGIAAQFNLEATHWASCHGGALARRPRFPNANAQMHRSEGRPKPEEFYREVKNLPNMKNIFLR